jgi:membrane protease subunit HflC
MNRLVTFFVVGFIALMLLSSTVFVVDQRKYAIVFALGEVREVISKPGLHFKLPPPFQNVLFLDKRILTIDTPDADRFITAEKKNILVDAFVKWRITDPRLYYVSFSGEEARARDRMGQIVKSALNDEITKRTVREVISGERGKVMEGILGKVKAEAKQIGVEIIGVPQARRLRRADQRSVYERMTSARVANELRSTGSAESEDPFGRRRQRTVILAEAFRDAKTQGDGDASIADLREHLGAGSTSSTVRWKRTAARSRVRAT